MTQPDYFSIGSSLESFEVRSKLCRNALGELGKVDITGCLYWLDLLEHIPSLGVGTDNSLLCSKKSLKSTIIVLVLLWRTTNCKCQLSRVVFNHYNISHDPTYPHTVLTRNSQYEQKHSNPHHLSPPLTTSRTITAQREQATPPADRSRPHRRP